MKDISKGNPMRHLILKVLFILFIGPTLLFAMDELKWGGPGYDPSLEDSSLFIARSNANNNDANTIEIWVDSQETVNEVGLIQLIYSDGQKISSAQCWKAMRHITAPWACSFHTKAVKQLKGEGKITVKNRSGDILIEHDVDLEKLSSFSSELDKEQ
jgi:hypothetical protein